MPVSHVERCLHCHEDHELVRPCVAVTYRCHEVQAISAVSTGASVTRWELNLFGREWISGGHTVHGTEAHADFDEQSKHFPDKWRALEVLTPET